MVTFVPGGNTAGIRDNGGNDRRRCDSDVISISIACPLLIGIVNSDFVPKVFTFGLAESGEPFDGILGKRSWVGLKK